MKISHKQENLSQTQDHKEFLIYLSSDIKDLKEKPDLQMAMASHLRYHFNKLTRSESMAIVREFFATL